MGITSMNEILLILILKKMRTKHLFLAMTALLVAGCTQNEVLQTPPTEGQEIGFGIYTGVQTKGTETTTAEIQKLSKGFGIFAYLHNKATTNATDYQTYMDNVQVTYDGTSVWKYSPLKYWPTDADATGGSEKNLLDFYAYAPYNAQGVTFDLTAAGTPKLKFEVQAATGLKDMPDLVVAEAQKDMHKGASSVTSNSGKVSFTLKHILSKVAMQVKTSKDLSGNGQTKIYLTKVEIEHKSKLHNKGTYDMTAAMSSGAWTYGSTFIASPYDLSNIMNLTSVKYANYTKDKAIDITANPDGVSLFQQDECLYFLPEASWTNDDVTVKFSYDVVVKANDAATTATKYSVVKAVNLPIDATASVGFKKGQAYLYKFTIGLDAIEVKADVTAWGTPSSPSDITL